MKKLLEAEQQIADEPGLKVTRTNATEPAGGYRNGFYEQNNVTQFNVLRLRTPRTRQLSFFPQWIAQLQRRAPKVAELMRQATLPGISTRQVKLSVDNSRRISYIMFSFELYGLFQ